MSEAAAADSAFDVPKLEAKRFPAIVKSPINTQLSGTVDVTLLLPFPGRAAQGTATCRYGAAGHTAPRIRLRCDRILPEGRQRLIVEAEFYSEDGLVGVPAARAPNGDHYTDGGGQAGYVWIERMIGVEP